MAVTRRIWLCADDYGISPSVSQGIRELIAMGRLNATSVMVVASAMTRDEAAALRDTVAKAPCAVGLHCTLTAPFHPLTLHFRPQNGGAFLPLGTLLQKALLRRLDVDMLQAEIAAQIAAFAELFGRPPDYVDGHHHVQVFPQISDAFIAAVTMAAPQAWIRQCRRGSSFLWRGPAKAMLLDALSTRLQRMAAKAGLATNSGFAGAYDFGASGDFGPLMASFFEGLPDDGLVMCHPGHVDAQLRELDIFTDQREVELNWLASDAFPALMERCGVALARFTP